MGPTPAAVGFLPMAVGAAHFAFAYFFHNLIHTVSQTRGVGDIELLVMQVVELKDDGVCLPAVHAGVGKKVFEYEFACPAPRYFIILLCSFDDLRAMRCIMFTGSLSLFLTVFEGHGCSLYTAY